MFWKFLLPPYSEEKYIDNKHPLKNYFKQVAKLQIEHNEHVTTIKDRKLTVVVVHYIDDRYIFATFNIDMCLKNLSGIYKSAMAGYLEPDLTLQNKRMVDLLEFIIV